MKHSKFFIIIALSTSISFNTNCAQGWIPNPFSYFSSSSVLEKMCSWSTKLIIATVATGLTILAKIYGATTINSWITSIINPEAYAAQQKEEIQKLLVKKNYNPKVIEELLNQNIPAQTTNLEILLKEHYAKEFDTNYEATAKGNVFIQGIGVKTNNLIKKAKDAALKTARIENTMLFPTLSSY